MIFLDKHTAFPDPLKTDESGIVAFGGDLSMHRLLDAYRKGIFPWYNPDEPIIWHCPSERFILEPKDLHISKSMQQVLKKQKFEYRYNTNFPEVIRYCRYVVRDTYGYESWITDDMELAYNELHKAGYAICAETYENNMLVGGLYGLWLGNYFAGESMFAKVSNASKFAFIKLVQQLQQQGVQMIDCQVYTEHLASLGATLIDRSSFLKGLKKLLL